MGGVFVTSLLLALVEFSVVKHLIGVEQHFEPQIDSFADYSCYDVLLDSSNVFCVGTKS